MQEHESFEPGEPTADIQAKASENDAVSPQIETPRFRPVHAQATPLRERFQRIDQDDTTSDEQKQRMKRELILQEVHRTFSNKAGRKRIL